jgi:hypothetical protein
MPRLVEESPIPTTIPSVHHPNRELRCTRPNGNVLDLAGRVAAALRGAGFTSTEISHCDAQATAGDSDNPLGVCMVWADVS